MSAFRMPSLGADMRAGTVTKWYVKPGDPVKRGDVVAAVETEKSTIDVEVYETGVIDRLVAPTGEKLPVGAVLAYVRTNGEAALAAPAAERAKASPAARKLARERGIDLATVRGSGPHGVIERADVERAAAPAPPPPAAAPAGPGAPVEPSGIRHAIALAMARANREIPHYYLATRIDMHAALAHLEERNRERPIAERILPAAMLLKAVALALAEVPALNGFWADDRPQPQEGIHLGVAIALRRGGLLVPAIHDADGLALPDLMAALRDLITRTRAGRLRGSELTDATITVTNLGDLGVETVYGVIYPPQLALVGFGRIVDAPVAVDGLVGVRPTLTATLAGDHRATDGHDGARFLTVLDRLLRHPEEL